MKALQKTQPVFGLELRDVPRPASPAPGEVIVEVLATGICGTDLHIYEWTAGYEVMTKAMPVTLGHEFSGTIAAVGAGVQSLRVGALVAIRPSVVCGRCPACLAGNSDACKNRKGIGVTRDGGLAKRVHVPAENCVLAPAGLDADIVALTEPMTVSAEAVATGEVRQGDRVLVLGPGNIGQGVALFAREVGAAQVVIVGKDDVLRLDVLRRMGFSETVDLGERTLPLVLQNVHRYFLYFALAFLVILASDAFISLNEVARIPSSSDERTASVADRSPWPTRCVASTSSATGRKTMRRAAALTSAARTITAPNAPPAMRSDWACRLASISFSEMPMSTTPRTRLSGGWAWQAAVAQAGSL